MKSFKDIAYEVLKEESKPLHYREITTIAIKKGLLKTDGKTPWATMNAQLSMDIVQKGEESRFVRTEPGFYALNPNKSVTVRVNGPIKIKAKVNKPSVFIYPKHKINQMVTSKQKGDIAEARVAELITLYGDEGLSCYKPLSDDEGIDLIVKRRGRLEVVYLQIKSTYGYKQDRGFVSTVKESKLIDKTRNIIVFVYFDLSTGDLYDQIFCIPVPDFLKLTHNEKKKEGHRVFTVGLKNPDRSKYAEFMIEKRELANKIIEIMDKL